MTKSEDWRDLFDVVVCSARKPSFYSGVNRQVTVSRRKNLIISISFTSNSSSTDERYLAI